MGYEKVSVQRVQKAPQSNQTSNLGNSDLPELIYYRDSQSAPVDLSGVQDQPIKKVTLRGT